MADRIFVENLVVEGKHGVSLGEKERAQEFLIDISVEADTKKVAKTDELADTVNYKNFVEIAKRVVEGPSIHLVEAMAHKIADAILEDKRVKTVSVTIRKPQILASGVPGVSITRGR